MTENPQQNQPAQQPTTRQAGQPAHSSARRSSTPETFGDGSTRAQQEQRIREAEEANQQVKDYADAERKAREDATS